MENMNALPVETTESEKKKEAFQEWLIQHPEYLEAVESRIQEEVQHEKAILQAENEKVMAEMKANAEKMALMSTEEKLEHLKLEKEKELDKREKELAQRENRAQALEMLNSKGLPVALLDALCFENMEKCLESLSKVEAAFRSAVQSGVTARMQGKAPIRENQAVNVDALADDEYYQNLYANKNKE